MNEKDSSESTVLNSQKILKPKVLVVDDDQEIFHFLKVKLVDQVKGIDLCSNPNEALKIIKDNAQLDSSERYDLILCDLQMPGMNGIHLIREIRKFDDIAIILMTAYASVETAVEAIKIGADDYIVKPLNVPELKVTIQKAVENRMIQASTPSTQKSENTDNNFIGRDPKMENVFQVINKVSKVNVNVLLYGQSGTGKELVAQSIHKNGPRGKFPFVAVNCTAIPENLLESELFGHAKGSFTGAVARRKGLIEAANGGTLFLDEIGDMPIGIQGKLLRFIQEREFKAVGDDFSRTADVRIIAATHRSLKQECVNGKFREDLYYRLNVVCVEIPKLADRKGDIPLLAEFFLKKYSQLNPRVKTFSPEAIAKLKTYSWPGNIRELENVVERALVFCAGTAIEVVDLNLQPETFSNDSEVPNIFNRGLTLKEIEYCYIQHILKETAGKKEAAAHHLGIDRKTLYRKELDILANKAQENKSPELEN